MDKAHYSMRQLQPLVIEVDMDKPHTWWGYYVHRWACNAENGLHVCMRGALSGSKTEPGRHRCACGERW